MSLSHSEFITYVLLTQGETLKRLAAFFGEEGLLTLLETAGETYLQQGTFIPDLHWFDINPSPMSPGSAYTKLENSVHELKLPAVLEFHLWAYPFYRCLIESDVELTDLIRTQNPDAIQILVDEAFRQAREWIITLPIRPELSAQVEQIALIPWLRFRSEVLKKSGKAPITRLAP